MGTLKLSKPPAIVIAALLALLVLRFFLPPRQPLSAAPGSPAALALEQAMSGILCRQSPRLPFESVTVYETGQGSLSITFSSGGCLRDLVMLSESQVLYDIGTQSRNYQVGEDAYSQLAAVVIQYGIAEES